MRKAQRIILAIVAVLVVGLAVLNLTYQDGPEPDAVYEMANRNIHWYYAGN